jgi:MYXO-CTERM domain-containing protein
MVCFGAALERELRTLVAVLSGLAVVLVAPAVHALTFPLDTQWVPLTCNGQVLTDAVGEVQPAAIDAVGDPSNPAAYVFMDAASLFLRLRMNAGVQQSGDAGAYLPEAWACLIWTAGNGRSYLAWDGVNGIVSPADVELLQNTQPQPGNPTHDPAETVLATYPIAVNAREAPASSNFGGDPDVFIDWAVSLSDLAKVAITPTTPLRFLCGTSRTQRILDADVIGDEMSCAGGISDGALCSKGSCSACTTMAACGPTCAACGAANACNPAVGCTGSCTSSAQCSGATPVCDTARGWCVECASNASCSTGTYCDAMSGACTPCAPGASSCTGPAGNVLANGSIEGGSCACDAPGASARPGALAGLALGLAAAMRIRRRREGTR